MTSFIRLRVYKEFNIRLVHIQTTERVKESAMRFVTGDYRKTSRVSDMRLRVYKEFHIRLVDITLTHEVLR